MAQARAKEAAKGKEANKGKDNKVRFRLQTTRPLLLSPRTTLTHPSPSPSPSPIPPSPFPIPHSPFPIPFLLHLCCCPSSLNSPRHAGCTRRGRRNLSAQTRCALHPAQA